MLKLKVFFKGRRDLEKRVREKHDLIYCPRMSIIALIIPEYKGVAFSICNILCFVLCLGLMAAYF